ncbi:TPA: hypothetical protein DCP77_00725 [Candidatus Collierbacteria bacterium]|uniref:Response regulatory domain-containing protein n=1 Tax=Candidatus Collierbacteria bacterium GW2011_GWA2_42_17 TaxID=1618378 RepID=A0A0G1BZ40_9BACT|nr:MAG: hypothetical protein UU94_C0007G0037 [Candidatus Collierbacteria bacterium GW2011_GWB2_42_12]KKS42693.1 MAG: hypothetical protein UV06_C0007G0023 [Candidatus Collierbacteria bacterium GW2011_GWA2_42_17]KKS61869.1 MAG: hypothetical protein UV28_C0023G0006 [Candidatus Collierbacteria bacterium GW2011_GWE2_42_48]KKS63225.1 MAG: hypothetical protein UV29_C0005G0050 [Candidatus Collierbacteria bacterium GW2011_GWD2_42_50]KKS64259.1 MAG: hypothetical protein UV32_C0019G0006 [Candidatus Collie
MDYSEHVENAQNSGQKDLLKEAKSILKTIQGELAFVDTLPIPLVGTENLRDKKITLLDDQETVFGSFVPRLLVETNGKAAFIYHQGQTAEEIIEELLKTNPDAVLIDYNLANGIKGSDLVKILNKKEFPGKVFGFSTDMRANMAFKEANADGVIYKDINNTESPIRQLSQYFS